MNGCWVYIRSEPSLWTVGFYGPDADGAKWHSDSDHESREAAAERVHWLNGGELREWIRSVEATLEQLTSEHI